MCCSCWPRVCSSLCWLIGLLVILLCAAAAPGGELPAGLYPDIEALMQVGMSASPASRCALVGKLSCPGKLPCLLMLAHERRIPCA